MFEDERVRPDRRRWNGHRRDGRAAPPSRRRRHRQSDRRDRGSRHRGCAHPGARERSGRGAGLGGPPQPFGRVAPLGSGRAFEGAPGGHDGGQRELRDGRRTAAAGAAGRDPGGERDRRPRPGPGVVVAGPGRVCRRARADADRPQQRAARRSHPAPDGRRRVGRPTARRRGDPGPRARARHLSGGRCGRVLHRPDVPAGDVGRPGRTPRDRPRARPARPALRRAHAQLRRARDRLPPPGVPPRGRGTAKLGQGDAGAGADRRRPPRRDRRGERHLPVHRRLGEPLAAPPGVGPGGRRAGDRRPARSRGKADPDPAGVGDGTGIRLGRDRGRIRGAGARRDARADRRRGRAAVGS